MARETLKNFLRSGRYPRPNENPDGIIQYTLEDLVGPTGGPDSSGLAFEFNTGVPLIGFDAADPDVGLIGNFLHFVFRLILSYRYSVRRRYVGLVHLLC